MLTLFCQPTVFIQVDGANDSGSDDDDDDDDDDDEDDPSASKSNIDGEENEDVSECIYYHIVRAEYGFPVL